MSDLTKLVDMNFVPAVKPAEHIGSRGDLKWIALDKLGVDQRYQREILKTGKANIGRMVERFSWSLFGVLIVAKRGESYAIIDGQHRATAAKMHGAIAHVPCLVLPAGVKEEALAFAAINGNVTRMHVLQSFRAKATGGDIGALALIELVGRAGVTIAPYPKSELKPGETLALGTLRVSQKAYGDENLIAALKFLRSVDPELGLPATAILGTCEAFSKNADVKGAAKQNAAKVKERGGIPSLVARAIQRRTTHGGTEWRNFSAVLIDTCRSAARTGNVPMSRLMAGR